MEDDGEPLELSGNALAALKEFYSERDEQKKRFEDLKVAAEARAPLSMQMFSEDWNASQFWYSDDTANTLAREILSGATDTTAVAVVSAPSVYVQMKNIVNSGLIKASPRLYLLEYDDRFAALDGFVHYDYNAPIKLPQDLKGKFDRIVCDPPFLSEDCQTKAALTVRWLSKQQSSNTATKVLVCTGERMAPLIHKLYNGIKTTSYLPQHEQSRLSNEFRSYANFKCDSWNLIED